MRVTSLLKDWILGLSGSAVFCAVMCEICPKGGVKAVVKGLCGVVMSLALLSPLAGTAMPEYSLNLAKYRTMAQEAAESGEQERNMLSRPIIEEECRAYILDKGEALGADIRDASVSLRWSSEGFWYPAECRIEGKYHSGLAGAISAELGLGEESQVWTEHEAS